MDSPILPEEETACDFKDLQSTTDPDSLVDSLRVSLESCEPFSVTDPDPFNCLGQPDISWTDTLVDPLNSIVMSESSELRDRDGKDHNRLNDACERKVTEVTNSSTRRSTRKSKSNQKIDAELAARKHRTTVCVKKPLVDLLLVNVGRRRRSDLAKRGRVSTWGLVGSINEVFEQNAEKNVTKNEHIASKKGMNGRRSGKRNNNVVSQSIENSGGESQVLKRGIRVKFKLGSKAIQSCQFNIAPIIKEDLESNKEVKVESSNLPTDIKDEYEEQVPCGSMSQSFNEDLDKVVMRPEGSVIDVLPADKDKSEDSVAKGGNNIPKMIGVGETVENRCLDPGTSPDSEVIDVIPETHVSGIAAEGSHDVQILSKDFVAHKTGDCGVASGLPSPDIIDDVLSSDKCGADEQIRDDSCASVAYISKTTVVASSNASSRERCPMEPMASLQETEIGVPLEMLKIASERQPELSLGVGLEAVDSQGYEKSLSDAKFNGQKLQKSSRSRGPNKSKSEVPDPVNKKRAKSRHKGLLAKSNGKGKNKEKNGNQASCEMDPETGNCEPDDIVQLTEGCQISAGALSNSTMVPSEGENHDGQPRNAWVCCDDCHKWRRIPAILADSIESTECRWICKDNMDTVFADCSIPQEKSNAEINEELEISDASCEEDACETHLNANRLGQKQPRDPPQSSWKLIRTNLFLHRNRKNQTVDEIMVCHCKPPTDGRRGCRDGCLNRMLNIECVKGTCPCGELCSNQQFQKRNYAKLKCFRCGKKGYGLQLLEDIPKGRFLIEYVGEVLDMPSYEARQREYAAKGHKHFYFMTLNGSEVIDACAKGNLGRFINHSCEPNCRTEKWMVNGEVCIGLFAIRDIKKGEELTFDYNYVRVFGAAAKKCVCGSSRCRGFIGGDPLNAETVVLGDSDEEYPEPVMLYDSGDKLENIFSGIGSFDSAGIQIAEITSNGGEREKVATAAEHLENAEKEESPDSLMEIDDKNDTSTTASGRLGVGPDNDVSFERSSYAASESECKIEDAEGLLPYSVQPLHTSLQPNDGRSETTSIDSLDHSATEEDSKGWFSTGERIKTSLGSSASNLLAHIVDTKRKSKSHLDDNVCTVLKPHSRTKISRPSSSVKRGKPINNVVNVAKPPKIEKTLIVPQKTKRLVEDALNGRFEAVQETLNALLNADGGISKRRDASKGYLKLLFLTAASGDSGNGEGIQSNRDLSMILDALLKTKSRTVLLDVINKNGLQMLHNIMKRYRREFNKIPILRKLLKVLEYLAEAGILTLENILKPPSCLGAESFRQSMLLLTEHTDKQVHQIARNFRDRWIPRSFRRINLVEKDVEMMESQRSSNFSKSKTSQNPSSDQDRRASEVADNCIKQSFSAHMPPVDGRSLEGSSASCVSTCITDGTRSRKRKSRWDMPGDVNADIGSPSNKESRLMTGGKEEVKDLSHVMHEERLTTDEDGDAPPGFSSPINRQVLLSHASSTSTDSDHVKAVIGYPQERFTSQLSTSYGVPSSILKRVGATEGVTAESWVVAPAVTFHPFPPLPLYPRGDNSMSHPVEKEQSWRNHMDATWSNPTTSGTSPTDMPISGPYNQNNFQRFRNSNRLGRRYFKQQKWNHSRPGLPWNTNKNSSGGFIGANNSKLGVRYGGNEANGSYNAGVVSSSNEAYGNSLYHQPQH